METAGSMDGRFAPAHRSLENATRFPQFPQGLLRVSPRFLRKYGSASGPRGPCLVKTRGSMILKSHMRSVRSI
jgi:hypothetical protein